MIPCYVHSSTITASPQLDHYYSQHSQLRITLQPSPTANLPPCGASILSATEAPLGLQISRTRPIAHTYILRNSQIVSYPSQCDIQHDIDRSRPLWRRYERGRR